MKVFLGGMGVLRNTVENNRALCGHYLVALRTSPYGVNAAGRP